MISTRSNLPSDVCWRRNSSAKLCASATAYFRLYCGFAYSLTPTARTQAVPALQGIGPCQHETSVFTFDVVLIESVCRQAVWPSNEGNFFLECSCRLSLQRLAI